MPAPLAPTLHVLIDEALVSSSAPIAIHGSSSASTVFLAGAQIKSFLESLQDAQTNAAEGAVAQIRVVDFTAMKKDEVAEKPAGAAASKEAKEAAAQKKKDGKKEDAYEMAVAYTKEGDFPGWYSDVSSDKFDGRPC